MNDQRTFAMFCTMDAVCFDEPYVYVFALVADEIEAVEAFRTHVADYAYNGNHSPHIHMEPMRAEWVDFVYPDARIDLEDIDLDPAANLFRQPAQVSS